MAADRRHVRLVVASSVAALAALVVSGCAATSETPSSSGSSPSAAASASSPSPSATPTASAPSVAPSAATASASPTSFDRTAVPGDHQRGARPHVDAAGQGLGPGWTSRVDKGSEEDGYTGNGTSVVARDPGDVVAALAPVRVRVRGRLRHAAPGAEARARGRLRLRAHRCARRRPRPRVLRPASARRFVDVYTTALRACRAGAGATAVVTVAAAPGAGLFASTLVDRDAGETWRELVARAGRVVRLISVEGASTPLRPWAAIAADLPRAA